MRQPPIDPRQLVDEELAQIIAELAQEQERRRVDRLHTLRSRIEALLTEEGVTLSDLFPQAGKARGRPKGKRQTFGNDLSEGAV
jgi:hypothetical protein